MRDSPYSTFERLLHRLALGSPVILAAAMTLDRAVAASRIRIARPERPVFVAGMARSGTTLILRLIHETGQFASLSYRDMPFVTAPVTWSLVSRHFRRPATKSERAHGDGIEIGYDSPEAFEEAFWRALWKDRHILADRISMMPPLSAAEIQSFRDFVAGFLSAEGGRKRYLSKNNNNILRLHHIAAAFPDAAILVPFRDPDSFVRSTLDLHRRFTDMHEKDRFSREYMGWLGHFEFGSDFRPAGIAGVLPPKGGAAALDEAYLWRYWTDVHAWLLENLPVQARFFGYRRFCADPHGSAEKLSEFAGIPASLLKSAEVRPAAELQPCRSGVDAALIDRAMRVYRDLEGAALNCETRSSILRQHAPAAE